ncbi:MAG: MSCRAMM family protein, partial [Pseudonocardiaceae bacterium]
GYAFDELAAGNYTLIVQAYGFQPQANSVVVGDGRVTQKQIQLLGNAQLEGVAIVGGSDRPLVDARVSLLDPTGEVVTSAITGADGRYRFADIAEGSYTLIATGYPPVTNSVDIGSGERKVLDIQLTHGAPIDLRSVYAPPPVQPTNGH